MPPTAPPNVTGQTSRGATLQVGTPAVPAGATTSIRWMRGKTRIPGAKASTYRLTNADLGHRMRAVVLVNRPGYRQMVLRTSWTPFVRTTPAVRMSTIPGAERLNLRVTMRAAGLSGVNARVQVRTGGELVRVVPIRAGAASTTLTGLRPGTRVYKFRIPATDSTEPGRDHEAADHPLTPDQPGTSLRSNRLSPAVLGAANSAGLVGAEQLVGVC